jgi:hypothetical protein
MTEDEVVEYYPKAIIKQFVKFQYVVSGVYFGGYKHVGW